MVALFFTIRTVNVLYTLSQLYALYISLVSTLSVRLILGFSHSTLFIDLVSTLGVRLILGYSHIRFGCFHCILSTPLFLAPPPPPRNQN